MAIVSRPGSSSSSSSSRLTGFFLCLSMGWMFFLFHYFTGGGDEKWRASNYQQLNIAKETALLGQRLEVDPAAHLTSLVVPHQQQESFQQHQQQRNSDVHGSRLRPLQQVSKGSSIQARNDGSNTPADGPGSDGVEDKCPGGIVALTYASHPGRDDRFCRTLESAIRNGVPLRVLGWGVPWEGLAQKLQASYDSVAALPADCVVLFTDGFDVLFLDSLQSIKDSFATMHVPLLFSGECGCWPQIQRGIDVCTKDYPEAPTLYRFLNSGSWMGYATYAKTLLGAIIQEGQSRGGAAFNKLNDQELVSDMYMAGRFNISLDHYARIFQSVHSTDAPLPDCHPEHHLHARDGYWFNDYTNSKPAIFHFNGGGKARHLPMESQTWYKLQGFQAQDEPDKVLDHRLWMNGEQLRLRDVCPSDFYNIRG